jgi:DNA polymerase IV
MSHQIRSIFADYTALIEPLSLDEAYPDVTENARRVPTASATAAEIRARIFDETGLTASREDGPNSQALRESSKRRRLAKGRSFGRNWARFHVDAGTAE